MGTNGTAAADHSHVFLGEGHDKNERRTWAVIILCSVMMVAEIVGGLAFGSIALVADGLHMSTHASALLLAALAYSYARRHAEDPRFSFGTGKLGDLAGFSSAIVLAMIAILIGYEAIARLFAPVPIHFNEAIPIAVLGLIVNVASVLLLSSGHGHSHHHGPHHGHEEGAGAHDQDAVQRIDTAGGPLALQIFERDVPPRFRLAAVSPGAVPQRATVETVRSNGVRQLFPMIERGGYLESVDEIPEPHGFTALLRLDRGESYSIEFKDHDHADASAHRDNNMRAAIIHVLADAVVSVMVIAGLVLARAFGWLFMDPVAGMMGALVIASWSYGLIRDTGAILLDMNPDRAMAERLRAVIERDGDRLSDLHLWRLGPGHLGAIVSVVTGEPRDAAHYRRLLGHFRNLSHVTVEVHRA
jgi:cation diffusion facilitator family transporter